MPRVRRRFVAEGSAAAPSPSVPYRGGERIYATEPDGEQEAHPVALARSEPPEGHGRAGRCACWRGGWSSRATSSPRSPTTPCAGRPRERARAAPEGADGCIPPKPSAEFVGRMGDVPEVDRRPYDPKRPVGGLQGRDVQAAHRRGARATAAPPRPGAGRGRVRAPRPRGRPRRRRAPVPGVRAAGRVAPRGRDRAPSPPRPGAPHPLPGRWDGRCRAGRPSGSRRSWIGSTRPRRPRWTTAFPPDEAERLANRLEIPSTPKHGSRLNSAEIEPSALARRCLSRRSAHPDTLRRRIGPWTRRRDAAGSGVTWQSTTADARIKLRSLYPSLDG